MIFGTTLLTFVHVVISLVGLGSGLGVMYGLLTAKRSDAWTATFLVSTVLTSATGFLFPFERFLPSHALSVLSLLVLAVAIFARYARHLVGAWRRVYVATAVTALYFNFFVLVVQLFQKVPVLKAMAPTQSEPPFLLTQVILLVTFVAAGVAAAIKSRNQTVQVQVGAECDCRCERVG
jgi:hypothetical protein